MAKKQMRTIDTINAEIATHHKSLKQLAADKAKAEITLKYLPSDENKRQFDHLLSLMIELEITINELQDEKTQLLESDRKKARDDLRQYRLNQAEDLLAELVLPGSNPRIHLTLITGMAEKLQFSLISGEDYFLWLQAQSINEERDIAMKSTLPNLGDTTKRFEDLRNEREEMEVWMAALRTLFDRIAPEVTTDSFKPVFLRRTDEQIKQALDKRDNERLEQRRAQREELKRAQADILAIEKGAAVR